MGRIWFLASQDASLWMISARLPSSATDRKGPRAKDPTAADWGTVGKGSRCRYMRRPAQWPRRQHFLSSDSLQIMRLESRLTMQLSAVRAKRPALFAGLSKGQLVKPGVIQSLSNAPPEWKGGVRPPRGYVLTAYCFHSNQRDLRAQRHITFLTRSSSFTIDFGPSVT